jgi:hypothetical protein
MHAEHKSNLQHKLKTNYNLLKTNTGDAKSNICFVTNSAFPKQLQVSTTKERGQREAHDAEQIKIARHLLKLLKIISAK